MADRYCVCTIRWNQLEPIHPGMTSREEAEAAITGLGGTKVPLVAVREDVWNAWQEQVTDEQVEDGEIEAL